MRQAVISAGIDRQQRLATFHDLVDNRPADDAPADGRLFRAQATRDREFHVAGLAIAQHNVTAFGLGQLNHSLHDFVEDQVGFLRRVNQGGRIRQTPQLRQLHVGIDQRYGEFVDAGAQGPQVVDGVGRQVYPAPTQELLLLFQQGFHVVRALFQSLELGLNDAEPASRRALNHPLR